MDSSAPKDSVRITQDGSVGLGVISPKANFHVRAGNAIKPPMLIEQGTLKTIPTQPAAIENDGDCLYYTDRKGIRRAVVAIPEACVPNVTGLFDLMKDMILVLPLSGVSGISIDVTGGLIGTRPILNFEESLLGNISWQAGDNVTGNRIDLTPVFRGIGIEDENVVVGGLEPTLDFLPSVSGNVSWNISDVTGNGKFTILPVVTGFAASGANFDITSLENCHLYYVTNTDATHTGEIRWFELASNGTNYIAFKAPDNLGSNLVEVLPSAGAGRRGESLMQYGSTLAGDSTNTLQFGPGHYVFYPTEASPTVVEWLKGDVAYLELTGNHAITFSVAGIEGAKYQIILKQGVGGSHLVTSWPTIVWRGGLAPTLTTTAGHYDIITLLYANGTFFGDISKDHS